MPTINAARPAHACRRKRLATLLPALPLMLATAMPGSADAAAKSGPKHKHPSKLTVSWIPPSQRQDGTALGMTEIAAYRVHYGPSPGKYTETLTITDAYDTDVILRQLTRGQTVYVVVEAVDRSGLASGPSEELAVHID